MNEVLSIIIQAIQLEEDGEKYYREAAARVHNPLARTTFEKLAEWEEEHKQLLRAYYDAMQQRGWPAMSEMRVKGVDVKQEAASIFAQALEQIEGAIPKEMELTDLYQGALEMERESIDLYRTQAGQTDDENAREFFEHLVEQERGHLNLLATTLEYLDDTDSWHFTQEQWTVEG